MGEYLSVNELTDVLGISRASVYRRMKEGLPFIKVGNLTRFHKGRVISWLENRQGGKSETSGDEILPVGDYRCVGCGWVGHVERPRPLSGIWCLQCGTKGQVEKV